MVAPAGLFSNRYRVSDMPDLTGKVAIVTGGSRGIGEALVSDLVQKNCQVHILSATTEHAQEAISNITKVAPSAPSLITHHKVDLGTLSSVISLSQELASTLPRLDVLYLIAGIGVAPFGLTNDGIGNHFGINLLAHLVLLDNLLPLLKQTSANKAQAEDEGERFSTRVVAMSSELHRASPSDVKFESLDEVSHEMDPTLLYGRSKLMVLLFIRELAKHHLPALSSSTPILALSTHPGAVSTEQQQGATEAYGTVLGKVLENAAQALFMSKEQGAESALWAGVGQSVVPRREEVQGRYFTEADGKVDTESEQGKDDDLARRLWDLSVKVLKDKAGYDVRM